MWVADEADILISQQAPADTFLGKLFRTKNTDPLTKIKKDFDVELASILERSFWLSNSVACLCKSRVLTQDQYKSFLF